MNIIAKPTLSSALARRDAAAAEIATMVEAMRVASNFSITEAQATTKVLRTKRGGELYNEYDQATSDAVNALHEPEIMKHDRRGTRRGASTATGTTGATRERRSGGTRRGGKRGRQARAG